jgi:hypothetical protein
MSLSILDYLKEVQGQSLPPLMLELILKSGRSFFIKQIIRVDDVSGLISIRVWDLRALSAEDIKALQVELNQILDREELNNISLHPHVDQGNLRAYISEIEAVVEWHDRVWPSIEEHQERRSTIGF